MDARWYKKVLSIAEPAPGHTLRKMVLECGHSCLIGHGIKDQLEHFCVRCADEAHHSEVCGKPHCAPCCLYENEDRPTDHEGSGV